MIISSTGSYFSILLSFDVVTASAILFPINSPALWTTFLEAVSTASSPVSNIYFLQYLASDKNSYSLTKFFVLGSVKHRIICIY